MTDLTPEQKLEETVRAITEAGGDVVWTEPLADADDPMTLVAYRVEAVSYTHAANEALRGVRRRTESPSANLVPLLRPEVDDDAE